MQWRGARLKPRVERIDELQLSDYGNGIVVGCNMFTDTEYEIGLGLIVAAVSSSKDDATEKRLY